MKENRTGPRKRILKSGQIALSDKATRIECAVRNLSDGGACLQVSTTYGIPSNFALIFDGARRGCRVIWVTESRIGVAFV